MSQSEFLNWFGCIIGGFLSGSVMYCWLIPKIFLNKDICILSEDHNPGASNVFHFCGIYWGILCLFLDLLKGFVPVWIGCQIIDTKNILFAFVLAAPVLGHAIAPFRYCRGGKCIATAFGVLLGLFFINKIVFLLAIIYIIFSTMIKIGSHRVRSIVTFTIFGFFSFILLVLKKEYSIAIGCVFISLSAIYKHTNKLFNGEKDVAIKEK